MIRRFVLSRTLAVPDDARARLLLANVPIAEGDSAAAIPRLREPVKSAEAAASRQAGAALRRLMGIR